MGAFDNQNFAHFAPPTTPSGQTWTFSLPTAGPIKYVPTFAQRKMGMILF